MSSKSSFYNSTGVTNTQSNAIDASVDNAEASALASENSANSASTSASTATTKASEASTSASTATTKASEASTSASTATTKASEASTSAATATTKASESASSATASANSATSASTSASTATTKASEASSSASTALSHKNDAQTAKTAAETAETNAETAETNAASSATAASTSASSASTSASTATTKANEAATSASTATTKASEAATSASNASTSASTATTKASEASTSATNAASSATAASASKDAALAALDSFDDRYLGVKSSNPTVDNDGNALVAGSLYFNSTDDTMKVYEGSAWVAAYASLSGAVLQANNLSDLTSASDARANLGLGTAATTAATAYATAAQGTLATNALPKAGGTMTGNLNVGGTVTADAGSWSTVVSGNAITFDRNGENNIIADSGSSANLNLTAGNRIFYSADDYQSFKIGSSPTEKLRILSTGIDVTGTVTSDGLTVDTDAYRRLLLTYPDAFTSKLQVGFSNFYVQGSATNDRLTIANNSSGQTHFENQSKTSMVIDNSGDISFYEDTGTTAKFFWDASTERLGIGTTSPRAILDLSNTGDGTLNTTASNYQILLEAPQGTGDYGRNIGWAIGSGTVNASINAFDAGASNATGLAFSTGAESGMAERMVIDSSGRVGIGTSSPSTTLDITNTSTSNNWLNASQSARFYQSSSTNPASIKFQSADNSNGGQITWGGVAGDGPFMFKNYDTERMRIDSSGNVGIGTSGYGNYFSGNRVISLGSGSTIRGATSGNPYITIASNTFYDGTAWKYIQNQPVTSYEQYNGTHVWSYAASGTSGNNVSFSEAMRIDSSGNLLVGTTESNVTNNSGNNPGINIGVAGIKGFMSSARYQGPPLSINRLGNDGDIQLFSKDGVTVGSIGVTDGDNLYIASTVSNHAGLKFNNTAMGPWVNNTNSNGAMDIGTSVARFKDLYLSGGVYLGGTGAANKLDDYEEGTWTPSCTVGSVSSGTGNYTKVGRLVTITAYLGGFSNTTNNEVLIVSNLPFTGGVTSSVAGNAMWAFLDKDFGYEIVYYDGSSQIRFYHSTNGNFDSLRHIDLDGSSSEVYFTATYQVA